MNPRLLITVASVGLVASAACGQRSAPSSQTVQTKNGPVRIEPLAKLQEPWGLAYLPDGRLLVTEKPGRLRVFSNGRLSAPVSGVPAVAYKGQGGLLGVTADPGFGRNHTIYLAFAEPAAVQPPDAHETQEPRFNNGIDMQDTMVKGLAVARARLEALPSRTSRSSIVRIRRRSAAAISAGGWRSHPMEPCSSRRASDNASIRLRTQARTSARRCGSTATDQFRRTIRS